MNKNNKQPSPYRHIWCMSNDDHNFVIRVLQISKRYQIKIERVILFTYLFLDYIVRRKLEYYAKFLITHNEKTDIQNMLC